MISQSSSEQSICFVIPTETAAPVIQAIEEELTLELTRRDVDRVWSLDDVVSQSQTPASLFDDTAKLVDYLVAESRTGDHILIMSNGGFDAVHQRTLDALAAAAGTA